MSKNLFIHSIREDNFVLRRSCGTNLRFTCDTWAIHILALLLFLYTILLCYYLLFFSFSFSGSFSPLCFFFFFSLTHLSPSWQLYTLLEVEVCLYIPCWLATCLTLLTNLIQPFRSLSSSQLSPSPALPIMIYFLPYSFQNKNIYIKIKKNKRFSGSFLTLAPPPPLPFLKRRKKNVENRKEETWIN